MRKIRQRRKDQLVLYFYKAIDYLLRTNLCPGDVLHGKPCKFPKSYECENKNKSDKAVDCFDCWEDSILTWMETE